MSEQLPSDEQPAADSRSREVRVQESARRKVYLAGDFYAVLAEAAAAGFRAFRDEVAGPRVDARGLSHSVVLGLVQGHTTFAQKAAEATRDLLSSTQRESTIR